MYLMFLSASFLFAAPPETKFESKGGRFTIQFPAGSKPKTLTSGNVVITTSAPHWINSTDPDNAGHAVIVIYSDIAKEKLDQPELKKLLEKTETEFNSQLKGKIANSSESKVKYGDKEYLARDFKITKEKMTVWGRTVLIDQRLYQVCVVSTDDSLTNQTADDFISSFGILTK